MPFTLRHSSNSSHVKASPEYKSSHFEPGRADGRLTTVGRLTTFHPLSAFRDRRCVAPLVSKPDCEHVGLAALDSGRDDCTATVRTPGRTNLETDARQASGIDLLG